MPTLKDLTGQRFGKLVVINRESSPQGSRWRCACDCGRQATTSTSALNAGQKLSCGCLPTGRKPTHGLSRHPAYSIWRAMRRRCTSPKAHNYARYGGRNISVCDMWSDPSVFIQWAECNGYASGLEIDRIDNDKDYSPANCRFVPRGVNARNRSNNRNLVYKGESRCMTDWAKLKGLEVATIWARLSRGWSVEDALQTPVGGSVCS